MQRGQVVGQRQVRPALERLTRGCDEAARKLLLLTEMEVGEGREHEQVGPAYDALKADQTRAVSIDEVRARLAAEHEAAVSKTR